MAMGSVGYRLGARSVPDALLTSDEWEGLNEAERREFCGRLNYIQEISTKTNEYLDYGYDDILDILDELELDLFMNLSIKVDKHSVSPWMIHTSWTFGSLSRERLDALSPTIIERLSKTETQFNCSEGDLRDWLRKQTRTLQLLLDNFCDSQNFNVVVSHLIGIDVVLCALLLGVSKQRLNHNICRNVLDQ
jgi:hypothetical protein